MQFRREPKPGDLIEIFRVGFQHWAIYVGNGYVIHLTPLDDFLGASSSIMSSILSSKAVVKRELLRDVVGNCTYRINNHLDHKYEPRPVNKILCAAKEKIGDEIEYSLLGKNCEHFVTKLRYGEPKSKQAEQVEHTLIGGAVGLGLGILLTVGLSTIRSRSQKQ